MSFTQSSVPTAPQLPIFISEIFPLTITEPNLACFRLTLDVSDNTKELGNILSFHLSRKLSEVVLIWHQGDFIVLAKPDQAMPELGAWQEALESIQTEVKDLRAETSLIEGYRPWVIQEVPPPVLTPKILAQLARQVLRSNYQFSSQQPALSKKPEQRITVTREMEFHPEVIDLDQKSTPALNLSVHSNISFQGNLAEFLQNHPSRDNPEKLLLGLHVQDRQTGGHGVIRELRGTIGEKRAEIMLWATGEISKQALQDALDDDLIVGVQFGKKPKIYEYAMAALRPRVTDDTDERFGVQYGQLLKATKIPFFERQTLLAEYKNAASQTLATFGFQLAKGINSRDYSSLFWYPQIPIDQTPLLFGKGYVGKQGQILQGLKIRNGGVYRRHSEYESRPIYIAALRLCNSLVSPLLQGLEKHLQDYGFPSQLIYKKPFPMEGNDAAARVAVERLLDEIAALEPDVVMIFLPESDRNTDKKNEGSLYQFAYEHLLRRRIASQFIYEDTLKIPIGQILNQVAPGILAKLGNLPFILHEPLEIADYFVGLDVSRISKTRLAGSMNACASLRFYGRRGEFVRYQLADGLLEGEEIPQRMLERVLPAAELDGKTILIYRDGLFRGQEVRHLLERAKAINTQIILVECIKSGVPRLYNLNEKSLAPPSTGLALRLSATEAILVTTKVSQNVGLARPLRLRIHEAGHQATIEQVVETTLKLTLLHHGALKTPRLPMPLHGADRMAYLRVSGIYPSNLEGDRQFWL